MIGFPQRTDRADALFTSEILDALLADSSSEPLAFQEIQQPSAKLVKQKRFGQFAESSATWL